MPPYQQPNQPVPPAQQPPVQPPQDNYNFAPPAGQQPAAPAPQPAPVQPPAADPNAQILTALQEVQNRQAALEQTLTNTPAQAPQTPATPPAQDQWRPKDWEDVDERIAQKAQEIAEQKEQERVQQAEAARQQQEQADQYIDNTLQSMRTAGLLPPVTNPYDKNDPGKQEELKLMAAAVSMGTDDLPAAMQVLTQQRRAGYDFDLNTRQFVPATAQPGQPGQPTPQPATDMWGAPVVNNQPPQAPAPVAPQPVAPGQPAPYPQQPVAPAPVGPTNPYAVAPQPQQYPAGFNAPVGSSNTATAMPSGKPDYNTIHSMNFDQIVNRFNQTQ